MRQYQFLILNLLFIIIFASFINIISAFDSNGYWSQGANVLTPRRGGAGAFWQNSVSPSFFFIGGDTAGYIGPTSFVDKYDILLNQWARMTEIPMPVWYHNACILKDSLYIVGGMIWTGFNSAISFVQKYDIKANSWTTRSQIPFSTAWNKTVAYQDSIIYSFGGFINYTNNGSTNVYLYNALSNSWRAATPLPDVNCGMAAVIIGDTIIIINGGQTSTTTQQLTERGVINQSDRSQISWSYGAGFPLGPVRIDAAPWGCRGIITTPGAGSSNTKCYVYFNDTWIQQDDVPNAVTLPACGSYIKDNIGKFFLVSGSITSPPYSVPYTQIYTDSVCFPIGIKKLSEQFPISFKIYQNYPNPFNPKTIIKFAIPFVRSQNSEVSLVVYDFIGKKTSTIVYQKMKPGSYEIEWDGSNFASGVYFYVLKVGDYIETKKMVLIK